MNLPQTFRIQQAIESLVAILHHRSVVENLAMSRPLAKTLKKSPIPLSARFGWGSGSFCRPFDVEWKNQGSVSAGMSIRVLSGAKTAARSGAKTGKDLRSSFDGSIDIRHQLHEGIDMDKWHADYSLNSNIRFHAVSGTMS